MIDRTDPQWYRDAIIYQVHVKSFFDSNNDGIGDFRGVTERLDYVKELGATAIWLMPFYPSPLRDDGYDISDYREVNPSYGTMDDFRALVEAAHERGLRIITELVINHTSDQHPWFQAARNAPAGSPEREFYVWSDTDQKYGDTRIIFLDTEPSNWTWDPVAKAYFWHRFYSHQPDLNFDNPAVLEAVLDTMRYWLDMGVDGLRLDAIPYLVEREGTNCENLPETHVVIKKIRAALDASYPDRMLLAEANQWPEETAPYFGDGDECHLSFHFPLMPRMYMALAQEDRHPITDIMRQTPEIPEGCQWAIFLRNHDELTLEMVTQKERDYLWSFYAAERRARINLGIRRRLAPLLQNDRRKTELLVSLLLSMPGTPVWYYGDEIGMGDNIYLGDRDGVRTPMQWSPDRNGGFSRADPARLYLPAIQDAIYGFNSVNVEAQLASPASQLNWSRRMLAVRKQHRAFGRGGLRFLYPTNRKVLAYLRDEGGEHLLCVANVSSAPQAVELDLAEFKGSVPVELTSGSVFPPVGGLPYLFTLPAYGFYWFQLESAQADRARFGPAGVPELFTLVLTGRPETLLQGREKMAFERNVAPQYLPSRRWFASKADGIASVHVTGAAVLEGPADLSFLLPKLDVTLRNGQRETYFAPLAVQERREDESVLSYAVARVRRGPHVGLVFDADASPAFGEAVLEAFRRKTPLPMGNAGQMTFDASPVLADESEVAVADIRRLGGEQSNTSIQLGDRLILKIARRITPGVSPEVEVGRFLTEVAHFPATPEWLGTVAEVAPDGTQTTLAVLQRFVRNQGDAWTWTLNALRRGFETLALASGDTKLTLDEVFADYLPYVVTLGRRTADLHVALATPSDDPAFGVEPLGADDLKAVAADAKAFAERAFAALPKASASDDPVGQLAARRGDVLRAIDALSAGTPQAVKTRVHGDYHLGQVLIVQNDVLIVDFEGEPSRPLEERRAKSSPLRDVAGMLRSFAYAAEMISREVTGRLGSDPAALNAHAAEWRALVSRVFLAAYDDAATGTQVRVEDSGERTRLLNLHLLAKALYEVVYEANNRPDWIAIPAGGVLDLIEPTQESA